MNLFTFLSLFSLALTSVAASSSSSSSSTSYPVGAKGFDGVTKTKNPLRILLSNDDSWASSNIRATYYALKTAGHKVLMVAPAMNQSGKGGTVVFPAAKTLAAPGGRFNSIPAGAPFAGTNASDPGLAYFDGTPAACVLWGFDNVAPDFFKGKDVELVVSGPNDGTNLGAFLYTLSGTIGASYAAVGRGVPGIAFSASSVSRDYTTLNFEDSKDESIQIATYTANIVSSLADLRDDGKKVLPLGLGANVNFAQNVGIKDKCHKAKFYHTRLTGGALTDKVVINATSGLPTYQDLVGPGLNVCLNGDCSLPGETNVIKKDDCSATISIYSVDYDAPTSALKYAKPNVDKAVARLNSKKSHRGHY